MYKNTFNEREPCVCVKTLLRNKKPVCVKILLTNEKLVCVKHTFNE